MEGLIFDDYLAKRNTPVIFGSDEEKSVCENFYGQISGQFTQGPSSYLVSIDDAIVWNNMLFIASGDTIRPIYETYRHPDRAEQGPDPVDRLRKCSTWEELPVEGSILFLGSAGSFNYGHWLVDDFARLKALQQFARFGSAKAVAMSSYNHLIDPVRCQGANLFLNSQAGDTVFLLDRSVAYRVKRLFYVTPISYHPVLKNGHALRFTREFLLEAARGRLHRRTQGVTLFVNRDAQWGRNILNVDDLRGILALKGFIESDFEGLDLLDQVALFRDSPRIVGILGAAMTNVLFDTTSECLHLAPPNWHEPFYWDLCDQIGHSYVVSYGSRPDVDQEKPIYRRSFTADLQAVGAFIRAG